MTTRDDEPTTAETERDILEQGSARPDAPGSGQGIEVAAQDGAAAAGLAGRHSDDGERDDEES